MAAGAFDLDIRLVRRASAAGKDAGSLSSRDRHVLFRVHYRSIQQCRAANADIFIATMSSHHFLEQNSVSPGFIFNPLMYLDRMYGLAAITMSVCRYQSFPAVRGSEIRQKKGLRRTRSKPRKNGAEPRLLQSIKQSNVSPAIQSRQRRQSTKYRFLNRTVTLMRMKFCRRIGPSGISIIR